MKDRETERVFAPAYLWAFCCDGSACGSRCCGGWRIPVDTAARRRLEALPEPARNEVLARMEQTASGWVMAHGADGNCAFLDDDGLCLLQKRYGESCLADICYSYPRVAYRFGDFTEYSLTMSCPIAARLALLSREPMRFAERQVPARRLSSTVRPPMEALRWEPSIREIQRRMIAMLQDRSREFPLRLLGLGRFLAAMEVRCGAEPPGTGLLERCVAEAEAGAREISRGPAFERLRCAAEIMAELYDARDSYTPGRLDELAGRLAAAEGPTEEALRACWGHVLENLAVNECFLRLYPFACGGGFSANFRLFVLRLRIVMFSLLLDTVSKGTLPDEAELLLIVDRIMERLDHNREADVLLKRRAVEDFRGMSPEAFLARI